MRRQRSDANQPDVVKRYREHGCSVLVLSQGHSVDLLVGCRGDEQLCEVKDGSKKPSARQLTPDEQKFHEEWRGKPIRIVETLDDVDTHVAELRQRAMAVAGQFDIPRRDLT